MYRWCRTRTNIDIDDELVQKVMRQRGLKSKRDAVDFALRRVVKRDVGVEELHALEGIGFDLTNDEIEGDGRDVSPWG